MERWRPIKGFEDRYEISSDGRVYSAVTLRYLKTVNHPHGYKTVSLTLRDGSGLKKPFLVHRLVAEAFIENPLGLQTVNHKDGVRDHNTVDNLEWMTHSQNHKHAYAVLGRKAHVATLRDSSRPCVCFKDGHLAGVFSCATAGAAHFGLRMRGVSRAALGDRKTCGGLTWVYVD